VTAELIFVRHGESTFNRDRRWQGQSQDALLSDLGWRQAECAADALKDWDMISFTWALKDMQVVAEMTDKAGLSLPITGAVKELVKEARRIKATNPPNWTGKGPTKYT